MVKFEYKGEILMDKQILDDDYRKKLDKRNY